MMKPVLAFVLGAVLSAVLCLFYVNDLKTQLQNAQAQTQQQQTAQRSNDQGKLQHVQGLLDSCQGKFSRATFLYEQPTNLFGAPFGEPARVWAIPVDVEPAYIGTKHGVFSHYDPKTQMETVKFDAKKQ